MTTPILRAGILIAFGWLVACSSVPQREVGQASDLPPATEPQKGLIAKIQKQYPSDQYLLGIGLGESGKAATELARADLAKKIRVEVRMVQVDLQRERGGKTEQEFSTVLETEVAELIKGIEIVEQGRDLQTGEAFAGVIYAHQLKVGIGRCVSDLEIIANVYEPGDMANQVMFLPL